MTFAGNLPGGNLAPSDWVQKVVKAADAESYAADLAGRSDCYVSYQSFKGSRRADRLLQLGCCYVDLDYYNSERWRCHSPEVVTSGALEALADARVPRPSMILSTGRGLLVVWLHELTYGRAQGQWGASSGIWPTPWPTSGRTATRRMHAVCSDWSAR